MHVGTGLLYGDNAVNRPVSRWHEVGAYVELTQHVGSAAGKHRQWTLVSNKVTIFWPELMYSASTRSSSYFRLGSKTMPTTIHTLN